jgi:hypothetical protein
VWIATFVAGDDTVENVCLVNEFADVVLTCGKAEAGETKRALLN